jgi:isopropylmalate/homocitrate/citramalate synthase
MPIMDITIELSVLVEEVDEENPTKSFLKRNKEFLTDKLISKTKETVKQNSYEIIEICRKNEIDLIGVYENFYRKEYKNFKKFYEKAQEKYLNDVEFNITVKVSSSY